MFVKDSDAARKIQSKNALRPLPRKTLKAAAAVGCVQDGMHAGNFSQITCDSAVHSECNVTDIIIDLQIDRSH